MEAALAIEVPAVEVRERLVAFVEEVCGRLPLRRQRENALLYVRGLVEQVGARACSRRCFGSRRRRRGTSRCSSFWPTRPGSRSCWSAPAPSGWRREIGVVAWVVDDTGIVKDGEHSPGVKRQYSGTLGKIGNCQITVSVHAVGERGTLPLGWSLYLPEEWCDDLPRRRKAKIPDEVVFETKPQLAGELASRRPAGRSRARRSWPTAPTATTPASAPAARAAGSSTSSRCGAETSVYGPETSFAVPERNGTSAGRATVARPDRKPESVRALAERLPATRLADAALPDDARPARTSQSRFAFVRVVAANPVAQPTSAAALGVADHRMARGRRGAERLLALQPARERRRASGSPGSRGCAGRSSSTTASSKANSGSTTTKAAATSASTTTARSSPAPTPSSRSNGSTQKPRGRPDTAAGGAAPAARPALLGRPLPNLPPARRPRPTHTLPPT